MKFPGILKGKFGRSGRGSVLVIAMLLLSSAGLRIATSAGSALAQDGLLPTKQAPTPAENGSDHKGQGDGEHKETHVAARLPSAEMSSLIAAITEREALVAEREKQLEMRLRALSVADTEIEKRLKALTETEESLRATLALADQASEKDITRLVTVYENMKPKEAAALFEQMEPAFAAGFLGRMRPDLAADVMTGLSPEAAYTISVILAGRNAKVPKT